MSAWLKALKVLTSRLPTEEEIDECVQIIVHEKDDRSAVLIDVAQLESVLKMFVERNLVALGAQEKEALFERDGPLASFSKLIRVAHAFGLIDEKMKRNLNIAREIRNTFAHSVIPLKFETAAVAHACNLFDPWFDKFEAIFPKDHPRTKFLAATTRMMMVLGPAIHAKTKPELPLSFG